MVRTGDGQPGFRRGPRPPDWVLRPTANRLPMQGRSQQVLDLTNPDAYRYIHDSIDTLVGELGIDYIKWDHNKFVTERSRHVPAGRRFTGRRSPCTGCSVTSSRASGTGD